MKLNRTVKAAIRRAIRDVCGGRRRVEVGLHEGWNPNFWGMDDPETQDVEPLDDVASDIASVQGVVALDCYVYFQDIDGEMDCNVYVLLDDAGTVLHATSHDLSFQKDFTRIVEQRCIANGA